jgi:hypothetical protein
VRGEIFLTEDFSLTTKRTDMIGDIAIFSLPLCGQVEMTESSEDPCHFDEHGERVFITISSARRNLSAGRFLAQPVPSLVEVLEMTRQREALNPKSVCPDPLEYYFILGYISLEMKGNYLQQLLLTLLGELLLTRSRGMGVVV